jgi:hypothetical protein
MNIKERGSRENFVVDPSEIKVAIGQSILKL